MAYDVNKDKVVSEKSVTVGDAILLVGVYCYNDGDKKLGEYRQITKKDNTVIKTSMGRKTIEEMRALGPLYTEMCGLM